MGKTESPSDETLQEAAGDPASPGSTEVRVPTPVAVGQIGFSLNTTFDHFASYLEAITADAPFGFAAGSGQIVLQQARPVNPGPGSSVRRIEMASMLFRQVDAGRDRGFLMRAQIEFEVVPLAANRIGVQAWCFHSDLLAGFWLERLLMPIIAAYPEARQQVLAGLIEAFPEVRSLLPVGEVQVAEGDRSEEVSADTAQDRDTADASNRRPSWLPKKSETLKNWKKAYKEMQELKKEWRDEYDDLNTENPNPTYADFRERLKEKHIRAYSEKRIGQILKAGQNGWLKGEKTAKTTSE